MAFVFKPVVTSKSKGEKRRRRSKFYWAQYEDSGGRSVRRALKLPGDRGITDKAVAESELRRLLKRLEREAAGLTDRFLATASTPIRKLAADFVRHLRHKRPRNGKPVSRSHLKQVIRVVKWTIDTASVRTLAELTEERTDHALGVLSERGRSPKTINHYRGRLHEMCEFGVRIAKLLEQNPVTAVAIRETATDVRKVRRALTHDEARRLLAVAGPRSLFYEVGLLTGLRIGEISALRWSDLDLDSERPAIVLRAEATKAGRAEDLPLHLALAQRLREAKPPFSKPTDAVFKTTPARRTFYRDCERAGIQWRADDRGRTVDRHALRTTFISWLSASGAAPRIAQALARHTDINLTMQSYTDPGLLDKVGAIAGLPDLEDADNSEAARATGTDGAVVLSSLTDVQNGSTQGSHGEDASDCDGNVNGAGDATSHDNSPPCRIGVTGFEPAPSWSQTTRSNQAELHPGLGAF